jgi:uncharacterized membrane protein YbhN (UPF0104 family)
VSLAGGVGYVTVPVAVALETVGVPVPAETTLVAASVLAADGRLNIAVVILLPAAAAAAAVFRALGGRGPDRGRVARRCRPDAVAALRDLECGRRRGVGDERRAHRLRARVGGRALARDRRRRRRLVTLARLSGLTRRLPRLRRPRIATRRNVVLVLGLGAAATGFAVFVLPELHGAGAEWRRVRHGDHAWLAAAVVAEVLSYAGYVVLLRVVFEGTVRWRESSMITMAGVAATRLLATAGAGGIALTGWALRRLGLAAHDVARGLVAFMTILYAVYMAALLVLGVGLGTGVLPGRGSPLLTLSPAALAATVIALALAMARAPGRIEHRLAWLGAGGGRLRRPLAWLASILADAGDGVRCALSIVSRRPAALLAALAWWGFDIAALAAAFHAFGAGPEATALVMGYFVGMLGNLLPLPGGVGGGRGRHDRRLRGLRRARRRGGRRGPRLPARVVLAADGRRRSGLPGTAADARPRRRWIGLGFLKDDRERRASPPSCPCSSRRRARSRLEADDRRRSRRDHRTDESTGLATA